MGVYAGIERLREIPKRDPNDPKLTFDAAKALSVPIPSKLKKA